MAFHFFSNGNVYLGPFSFAGADTIIVDPFADIIVTSSDDALTLSSGPWTIVVNGGISAPSFGTAAIYLSTPDPAFLSTITVGENGEIFGGGAGINSAHSVKIKNAGSISGDIGAYGGAGFFITNLKTGVIEGETHAISVVGGLTLNNAGTIIGGLNLVQPTAAIVTGDNIDQITNWGTISTGQAVFLGGGDDVFTNFRKVGGVVKHGTLNGSVDLGAGNDHFNGGNNSEAVEDGPGADRIKLGGGRDTYFGVVDGIGGTDGVDIVDGGKGVDTYDANLSAAGLGVIVNLDTAPAVFFGFPALTAGTFFGTPVDRIKNFEDVFGTAGDDLIFGSAGANSLSGWVGNDSLVGLGGKDRLEGGAGDDTFGFLSLKDSGPTRATRDTIVDFEGPGNPSGGDLIDLSAINTKLGGIITLLDVNDSFTGSPGDLRAVWRGGQTIVQIDKDGDLDADFSVAINGNLALVPSDFVL